MNRKKGILLIIAAVTLFAGFVCYELIGKEPEETSLPDTASEMTETETTATETKASFSTAEPEETDLPATDESEEWEEDITLEVEKEILSYMKISKKELKKQIRLFANSSGYTDECQVKDYGEMNVDFSKETITVPFYLSMGKKSMKFDAVYQYKKRKWRFVPW